ncbi:MAG: PDZ domain-containing protein, partial [Syntrophomonadaceae bacterium]|nr:PDZ domain-containing protein [Syntrophomonadaceae bacterium]
MVAQIKEVVKGSIAEEIGIEAGDEILSIDGFEIKDIIDYRFYSHDNCIQIELRKADQELWSLEIEKDYDEEMGIVFDDLIF